MVTAVCYALRLDLTVTAFLYLIVVVLQSLIGDFVSSAFVSIIADLCLNFFFAPPLFSFRVSDSSDFWALIAFLITGLVITRLTTKVRREMQVSELHRREMKLVVRIVHNACSHWIHARRCCPICCIISHGVRPAGSLPVRRNERGTLQ